eukprot:CAMPEP_0178477800 /NCGR_PEP_ID=MMETSP0696-20121128/4320_1 /TAXON_ID=265572 /ORGANISM="Extubocellulus spinifer, Strain CCMP396" /LENGTH=126 /DNA_ID=CAMNT_0020105127 /DNA_START=298 /DNA_END=678 /DNA_ORIENTATION=+
MRIVAGSAIRLHPAPTPHAFTASHVPMSGRLIDDASHIGSLQGNLPRRFVIFSIVLAPLGGKCPGNFERVANSRTGQLPQNGSGIERSSTGKQELLLDLVKIVIRVPIINALGTAVSCTFHARWNE